MGVPRSKAFIYCLAFVVSAIASMYAAGAVVDSLGLKPGFSRLAFGALLQKRIDDLGRRPDRQNATIVAFLGDSTVAMYPEDQKLPLRLERALHEQPTGRSDVTVENLAAVGMSLLSYYFVTGRLADADPDLVIWQTSFTHLNYRWLKENARVGLVGSIGVERLFEALRLPLAKTGLTTDQLLLHQAIEESGLFGSYAALCDLQSKVDRLRSASEDWLYPYTHTRPTAGFRKSVFYRSRAAKTLPGTNNSRYGADTELEHYRAALSGVDPSHLSIQALGAAVAHFSRADVPVLVYLSPINIEHFDRLGIYDEAGVTTSVAVFRDAVEENGGHFLDLHDLLPDSHFKDPLGHFVQDEEIDAPALVVQALRDAVVELLKREESG